MQGPIYRVVSLWVRSGAVAEFEAYERQAARIMRTYGGSIWRLVRRAFSGRTAILARSSSHSSYAGTACAIRSQAAVTALIDRLICTMLCDLFRSPNIGTACHRK